MGDGGVDLHGLQGLLLLLGGGLVLHGAHVVEPVGDLDEDDPDILAHGNEHLAQILHLLILFGGVLDPRQLADALHQVGHRGGEELGDLLMGGPGVLDAVVEQGTDDGLGVQVQLLGDDLGHRQGMDDIGLAALALLALMGLLGKVESGPDLLQVGAGIVLPHRLFEPFILFKYRHGIHLGFSVDTPGTIAGAVGRCSGPLFSRRRTAAGAKGPPPAGTR